MTSTGTVMTVAEYPWLFSFWHTPSDYLISTIFEQIGLLPIVGVDFCMEKLLVLCFPLCITKKLAMWANQGALSTASRDSFGNSSKIGGLWVLCAMVSLER